MNVLVIGSGGREHALVKALKRSALVSTIYAWPGNDGIFLDAQSVPVANGQFDQLVVWAKEKSIELVVVGPESELVLGCTDRFRNAQIRVFGPDRESAQLEGSKVYAKKFMQEYGIPTAKAEVVSSMNDLKKCLKDFSPPFVLKVDGLAAGKGVYICQNERELWAAGEDVFINKKFGEAGGFALLEEFLPGEELSVLVLTNGKEFEILPFCRDHKRLMDGDRGPNTGGMGVVAPVPIIPELKQQIEKMIIEKTLRGIQNRNLYYRGVLFVGVMITRQGPMALEYNVRFGDPETQVILPLLDGDWASVFLKVAEGEMPKMKWQKRGVACIVLAAEGYPDQPVRGVKIQGSLQAKNDTTQILHAGTKKQENDFVTHGGRILNVVSQGSDIDSALRLAYAEIKNIYWPGMQYRHDIGSSVLKTPT